MSDWIGWKCPCCQTVWSPAKDRCECQLIAEKQRMYEMQHPQMCQSVPAPDRWDGPADAMARSYGVSG